MAEQNRPVPAETPMSIDEALETMRVWSSMQTISAVRVVRAAECVAEYFGSTRLLASGAATPAAEAPDTATVLAGLREEMTALYEKWARRGLEDYAAGLRVARALVEAAQRRLAPPVSDRPAPEPGEQP